VSHAVVDASVLVELVTADRSDVGAAVDGVELHAPHLVDVEVASALRSLARTDQIENAVAGQGLATAAALVTRRYAHELLLPRVWELRSNLTAYDAVYVALAEALTLPLLTTDARLAAAPGRRCEVKVI
jgi:predicted nucleic acid-binding protein